MFTDWRQSIRELRYLNAINQYGPRVSDISRGLGIKYNHYLNWLVDATHRWPIYEDDRGGIYFGG
jgi:hypothetical protein